MGSIVNARPQPLYLRQRDPVPTVHEADDDDDDNNNNNNNNNNNSAALEADRWLEEQTVQRQ